MALGVGREREVFNLAVRVLAEQRDMRLARLHTYLLQGMEIQPGRTKKSFLGRTGAAWVWWVMERR